MAQLFDNYRKAPGLPKGWQPRAAPGAVRKIPIKNDQLRTFLQGILPGHWVKVYHYGADGSEIHYGQHASGQVFDVEYHQKLKR
jgi:hypothetical protein